MTQEVEAKIVVREYETACGQCFGRITLNKPKALNALDLDMATGMLTQLKAWSLRKDLLFVVVDGAGKKAFCAGGDIVSMYNAMKAHPQTVPTFVQQFFTIEYELDHLLHTYTKPVVVWGDGIVMGGGMGLLQGASHRVVTPASRLAMPEITIGLFPDVGGSYFLPRLPHRLGLFLGLTAAQINGVEAKTYGLADYLCNAEGFNTLLDNWKDCSWPHEGCTQVSEQLASTLHATPPEDDGDNRVAPWIGVIEKSCGDSDAADIVNNILSIQPNGDAWMERAQQALRSGSPITAKLFHTQFHAGKEKKLSGCFQMELILACRCAQFGELQEGIRALLIDKDGKPQWRFGHLSDVPDSLIEDFFVPPWQGGHPLAHLGE